MVQKTFNRSYLTYTSLPTADNINKYIAMETQKFLLFSIVPQYQKQQYCWATCHC